MMRWKLAIICALFVLPPPAMGKPLIADLSGHSIEIHSAFSGTELLLYGARFEAGDLIVVVRGPYKKFTVRKKERVAGIWVNRSHISYPSIPQYYLLASTRPLDKITSRETLHSLGIGVDKLFINPRIKNEALQEEEPAFRQALKDAWQEKGLYATQLSDISFIGDSLFKSVAYFPDTIPRGRYSAETYLFRYGELIGVHTTPLQVVKSGLDAQIYDLAHEHSGWYGLLAILIAMVAGWLAGIVFKKA